MKNFVLTSIFILAFSGFTIGQNISDHAIGLRLGDNDGFGAEISYQKSIMQDNRIEFDLGWRDSRAFDAVKLAAIYQWVRPIEGDFNWYYGAGGGIGNVDFEPVPDGNNGISDDDDGIFLFATGDIGVEYSFDFPLLLSLDARPELGLLNYDGFDQLLNFDIALGVRYQF